MASTEPAPGADPHAPVHYVYPHRVPDAPQRPRRWVAVLTVVWVVVLVAGGVWAMLRGEPTAREQTTVAEALPVLARATGEVAVAASADGFAVIALDGTERMQCSITAARGGARYQRAVLALVPSGREPELLQRVADRLPDSYHPAVRTGRVPRLYADAGLYVAVTGSVVSPGQVRFIADTGDCREEGAVRPVEPLPAGDPSAVEAALAQLGVAGDQWRTQTHAASCPGGGLIETVEAVTAEGGETVRLADLREPAGAVAVSTSSEIMAYRAGDLGVAVRVAGDQIIATSTRLACG